jgi:hypothetical protein
MILISETSLQAKLVIAKELELLYDQLTVDQ